MTDPRPRVVLLSLDAFNHRAVSPQLTPHLWELGRQGGWAREGGRCDLPAVTYVSHATLATGTYPATHGLMSNLAAAPRRGIVPGWAGEARVRVPTLFDALRNAGMRAAAVCGDQHLVQTMGAGVADHVWPTGGILPEGCPVCPSGYALNAAVREPLLAAAADDDVAFLFGHLNETDTWGHRFGPDHPETLRSYSATDALVGEVIEALRSDWERLLLIVVSDHGMEPVDAAGPIDLLAVDAVRATVDDILNEGSAALARVKAGVAAQTAGEALLAVRGVGSWREIHPGVLLIEGDAGAHFVSGCGKSRHGVHGGPGTTVTTAIVGGGHPAVARIDASLQARPPHLADWAPTIAGVLGVPFATAEGRNLAA